MTKYLAATCWGLLVGWLCIWATDQATAHMCAGKGRAWLIGGTVIECRVEPGPAQIRAGPHPKQVIEGGAMAITASDLAAALRSVLAAQSAHLSAERTLENARANFSDPIPEIHAANKAMYRSADAQKRATEVLEAWDAQAKAGGVD